MSTLNNLALALSLASLGVLQQVTAASAAVFTFSGGGDSGTLDVTTDVNQLITGITGSINGDTVTGLFAGSLDYSAENGNPPGSDVFTVDNVLRFDGTNVLTSYTGFGVNTSSGSIYNLYALSANESGYNAPNGFAALDGIAKFSDANTLVRDNSPGSPDFPVGSNLPGIQAQATAVPESSSAFGLLALGALGGALTFKKKLGKVATNNRFQEKVSA